MNLIKIIASQNFNIYFYIYPNHGSNNTKQNIMFANISPKIGTFLRYKNKLIIIPIGT
ncbi:protein of unknown function [Mycoplasma capricolum subsp. capripneumoniae]|nr:protein of unknown function [Mycoplasma capricolum subsp. capripneumoniae]